MPACSTATTASASTAPGLPLTETEATPWLYNLSAAWHFSPELAAYAGLTRGLEESGVAPGNASNRNQALPAILTTQMDAGLRWQMSPRLKLVAGVFDVRKPYYNLDAQQLFTELGDVRHRGIELSLNGRPAPEWQLVAGAVLMQPRVRGEGVALGRVGPRPVGQAERILKLNAVYRPAELGGLSFDAGFLAHRPHAGHARQPGRAACPQRAGPGPALAPCSWAASPAPCASCSAMP